MIIKDEEKSREELVAELNELRKWAKKLEEIYDRYEEAIRTLRSYEKALETMQIGVTITDLEGKIIYANRAELQMHGYSEGEVIGKNARIFGPRYTWKRMPRDEILKIKRWNRESVNMRKDGTTFPVQLMSDVVTDDDGEPIGIVTTCEDISHRKKMEEEIKSRVEELEKFYEMSVGRELRMQKLKREIQQLKERCERCRAKGHIPPDEGDCL